MTDLAGAIGDVARILAAAGISHARHEARLLAAAATGLNSASIIGHPERKLTPAERQRLGEFARRRQAREPISRILGWREFWSLRFALGPGTLDPRPDSETLVAAALEGVDRASAISVLDLGTGSGCLLLAMLSELPAATGLGIDLNPQALAVAAANARSLGLEARSRFQRGDWAQGLAGRWDLVLCNPPYVPAADIAGLDPEVAKFDPLLALAGGPDGLDAYRRLAGELARLLAPKGRAVIEIGAGQDVAAATILSAGGLRLIGQRADLSGVVRCLVLG